MILEKKLMEINELFKNELTVIKEHISFMETSVILSGISTKYYSVGILQDLKEMGNTRKVDIQNKIESLSKKNKDDISKIKDKIENSNLYEIPKWFKAIDARSYEGELVDYIYEVIENDIVSEDDILSELESELEALCITKGELIGGQFFLDLFEDREKSLKYIKLTKKLHHNYQIYREQEKLHELENTAKLLRLINTKNTINIYRQGFIQLIALFDTYLFDIMKIHFKKDFFRWLEFYPDDSIKLHDIAKHENFDKFENEIIDLKIKGVYLRKFIEILQSSNPELMIVDGEARYKDFIEMINRRNCHIHNNGIVDKSYLGINNDKDKPSFNIYNFDYGTYAVIDREYLYNCIKYCSELINNIIKI